MKENTVEAGGGGKCDGRCQQGIVGVNLIASRLRLIWQPSLVEGTTGFKALALQHHCHISHPIIDSCYLHHHISHITKTVINASSAILKKYFLISSKTKSNHNVGHNFYKL